MNYLKTSIEGFQPINVIPANEIKCSKCHKYYPIDLIDGHLAIHIKPKFILPTTKNNKLKKPSIPFGLLHQLKTQDNEIDVQTMMPEELPIQQKQRRNINVPKGIIEPTKNDIFDLQLNSLKVQIDDNDITSKIADNLHYNFQHPNQLIELQEDYQIPFQKTKLTKRTVNVYQNKKVHVKMENQRIQLKKRLPTENKDQEVYQIISNKDSEITNIPDNKTKRIQCGFVKSNFGITNSFITSSKVTNRTKNLKESSNQFESNADDESKCNCKCSCCGGFYCKVCNSSIPPQFRPSQPTDNSVIKNFWKMHHQNNKKCKNCLN